MEKSASLLFFWSWLHTPAPGYVSKRPIEALSTVIRDTTKDIVRTAANGPRYTSSQSSNLLYAVEAEATAAWVHQADSLLRY